MRDTKLLRFKIDPTATESSVQAGNVSGKSRLSLAWNLRPPLLEDRSISIIPAGCVRREVADIEHRPQQLGLGQHDLRLRDQFRAGRPAQPRVF
jgi:hypothetical protein